MSEYQYYEFQAVDRLLDRTAQAELRSISKRARITSSTFVNTYEWGDLKADPLKLLERYFDLHLYLANWGTRQFAMKLPARLVDVKAIDVCGFDDSLLLVRPAGDHVILGILGEEIETEDWDDGSGWLSALAPLRTELLAGDLRLLPLLWLIQVDAGEVEDGALEPSPGLGALTPSLAALAEFLRVDPDLLEAAAGSLPQEAPVARSPAEVDRLVRALPEDEKVALLLRAYAGEAHIGADLRRRCQPPFVPTNRDVARRTAGELRAAARRIASERQRLAVEKAAAEKRRREEEAARERAKRLRALSGREDRAWHDAEALIGQGAARGYDQAAELIADLGALADHHGAHDEFAGRLADLRARHSRKRSFIARLDAGGLPGG